MDGSLAGVAIGHGRVVGVGQDHGGAAAAWWSPDGERWARAAFTPRDASLLGDVTSVAGGFVAVGSHAGQPTAWWSQDGKAWAQRGTLPGRGHLVAVAGSRGAVLVGGAEQDGESDESTGPLLALMDRSGGWGQLSTDGTSDDLRHGSITALARHGTHWVLAGTGIGASGLWRSGAADRRWSPAVVPGREPVLWSSLLEVGHDVLALGTTIAGGTVVMARSGDARSWVTGTVPDLLASLGVDLRGAALDDAGAALVASATGAVAPLVDEVRG